MSKFPGHKLMSATLVAACMALAISAATAGTFTFSQSGFNDGATITGFFKAQDVNHDGKISGTEVWDMNATINGGYYNGFIFSFNPDHYRPFITYSLGSGTLGDHAGDMLDVFAPQQIGWTANGSGGRIYDGFGQYPSSNSGQMIQVVDPVAIPEPESWALMAAGLALLGAVAWRKKPQA